MYRLLFLLLPLMAIWGCVDPPDYPDEPVLKYEGMSKQYMKQGDLNQDELFVHFSFTDGDGDLSPDPLDTGKMNIFLVDSRDGSIGQCFRMPDIPQEGAGNGISGTVDLKIFNSCCIFEDGTAPCKVSPTKSVDTLYYYLYIEDRAGHKSNEIEVGPIYLRCE